MNRNSLFSKYDVPVPRYTSYPTVPYWTSPPTSALWITHLNQALTKKDAHWSLYIHLPFCESLCTYCGCNTSITRNHQIEEDYVNLILKEWNYYVEHSPQLQFKTLKQISLGGGSPTFFSPENLTKILDPILSKTKRDKFIGAIEIDPRTLKDGHLELLKERGFNRVSLGVQDFDPEVQRLINRIQPFELTEKVTNRAKKLGYQSINFDLIYGLPKQTLVSFRKTAELTLSLKPDRLALYSLAKVPWIKPAQRLFKDEDLPQGEEKRALYELARDFFIHKGGYIEIGMDHFALPTDSLYQAYINKNLHRNFMGYTETRTDVLLGLGVSAISEVLTCYHQNEKILPVYQRVINLNQLATHRGHLLTEEDQRQKEQILKLMTRREVTLKNEEQVKEITLYLSELLKDELFIFEGLKLIVTPKGEPFLRNICTALDLHFRKSGPTSPTFSKAL